MTAHSARKLYQQYDTSKRGIPEERTMAIVFLPVSPRADGDTLAYFFSPTCITVAQCQVGCVDGTNVVNDAASRAWTRTKTKEIKCGHVKAYWVWLKSLVNASRQHTATVKPLKMNRLAEVSVSMLRKSRVHSPISACQPCQLSSSSGLPALHHHT